MLHTKYLHRTQASLRLQAGPAPNRRLTCQCVVYDLMLNMHRERFAMPMVPRSPA